MNKRDIIVYDTSEVDTEAAGARASMFEYLVVAARHRGMLVAIILVGTLLAAGYLMVMPQSFVAGATLLPPDKSDGVSLTSLVQSSTKLDFKGLSENSSAEVLVRILSSRAMADSLIERFDLLKRYQIEPRYRSIAVDQVVGALGVSSDRQGFIDIAFTVRTGYFSSSEEQEEAKKLASDIVNATVEILDRMNRQKSVSKARRSREFLGRMRLVKRRELDTLQLRLQIFQQKNKAFAIDEQASVSMENLIAVNTEINKKEIELVTARNQFAGGPVVETLEAQLATLRRQLAELKGGRIGGAKQSFSLNEVPELMRQYLNLKLDLEVASQIYSYLEAQYNQEQVQEARDLPTVALLDGATPPIYRSTPRRAVYLLVVFVLLSVISIFVVFVTHAIQQRWSILDQDRRLAVRSLFALGGRRRTAVRGK